jgi:hypothetical protein
MGRVRRRLGMDGMPEAGRWGKGNEDEARIENQRVRKEIETFDLESSLVLQTDLLIQGRLNVESKTRKQWCVDVTFHILHWSCYFNSGIRMDRINPHAYLDNLPPAIKS